MVRPNDGVLSSALAGYLSWQQTAEERFLALEEARMRQEARAEERREQQEERRAKQERDHEFRLMSMLTRVLNSTRGTEDQSASTSRETVPLPSSSQTLLPHLLPNSAKTVPSMLWGDQTPQYNLYLSRRGNSMRIHQGILQEGYNQYHANKHDEKSNPHVSHLGNNNALLLLFVVSVYKIYSTAWPIKVIVHPEMNICSPFPHTQVDINFYELYELLKKTAIYIHNRNQKY